MKNQFPWLSNTVETQKPQAPSQIPPQVPGRIKVNTENKLFAITERHTTAQAKSIRVFIL